MKDKFLETIDVLNKICNSEEPEILKTIGEELTNIILGGGKLMFCGNGGSAADAQHLVAEMLVRLRPAVNRKGIPAISLAQDTSTLTACANDYDFDLIFQRVLETVGNEKDALIAITTSGNSNNIINVLQRAREMKIKTFSFLGGNGGKALELSDFRFLVPSNTTAKIQESHITAGHILMEYIEDNLIKKNYLSVNEN